ncbi:MgtC/SapB family protein [Noviherbaspirillum sp. ST9]|uniref:MgtC/SapB family protein n=1 Tax=Noviherbaspirillum sp. ST9 TaxID=3401606 RepID=UPI003B58940A
MELDLNILLRLLIALALAGLLGWERERTGKAAGVRTHMLVGMGAALFVILGELFVLRFREYDENMRFDPLRIIEAVVTGISFLGAGTIFVSRGEQHVKGLTTAASIWVTAAVGMLAGLERYLLAAGAAILVFGVLHLAASLKPAESKEDRGRE